MKIIFCLHHFLPEFVAGTEIYTLRLAQALQQKGYEILVLIPHFDKVENKEYEFEGIRAICYSETSVSDRNMILGKTKPSGLDNFALILVDEQPDLIHFHELAAGRGINIFHVEIAHTLKIPILLTCHLATYTCSTGSLVYKDIEKCDGAMSMRKCTECICTSKNISEIKTNIITQSALLLHNFKINSTNLNNSLGTALGLPSIINKKQKDLLKLGQLSDKIIVLTEWYKNILEKNGLPSEKLSYIKQGLTSNVTTYLDNTRLKYPLKIVFLGRISKLKGLHLLINAITALPINKISLHIYGQETEQEYALNCKQKSASFKNIHWMGILSSDKVVETLAHYHVLCLPSLFSEMSPLVIQEAFAAGIPVIASDVYGNAEQIQEGVNGWLFRFKDTKHLTEKLQLLMNDLSLIDRAKKYLPKSDSFEDIAKKHIILYNQVIINAK